MRARDSASRSSAPRARRATSCSRAAGAPAAAARRRASRRRRRACARSSARRSPSRGSKGCPYAEVATVLGIGAEGVGALLARARLRLHDELHGTALAGVAVRSPDCEDVVPLLAAAADGELDAVDAAWADPHVERCSTCPRTRRAMDEAAATYAAWSPAVPPVWLGEATLAEAGVQAPAAGAARTGLAAGAATAALATPAASAASAGSAASAPTGRGGRRAAAGAWSTPRPRLSAALLGAALLGVRVRRAARRRLGLAAPARPAGRGRLGARGRAQPAGRRRAGQAGARRGRAQARPQRPRRARATRRPRRVALTPVRAVRRVTSPRSRPRAAPWPRPRARPPRPPARAPSAGPSRRPPRPPRARDDHDRAHAADAGQPGGPRRRSARWGRLGRRRLDGGRLHRRRRAASGPQDEHDVPPPPVSSRPAAAPPRRAPPRPRRASGPARPAVSVGGQRRHRGSDWHGAPRPSRACAAPRGSRHR